MEKRNTGSRPVQRNTEVQAFLLFLWLFFFLAQSYLWKNQSPTDPKALFSQPLFTFTSCDFSVVWMARKVPHSLSKLWQPQPRCLLMLAFWHQVRTPSVWGHSSLDRSPNCPCSFFLPAHFLIIPVLAVFRESQTGD